MPGTTDIYSAKVYRMIHDTREKVNKVAAGTVVANMTNDALDALRDMLEQAGNPSLEGIKPLRPTVIAMLVALISTSLDSDFDPKDLPIN